MVGEAKKVNITRGQWNFIDLSEYDFATDKDFYISTIQTRIGNYSPGLGIDEDSEDMERAYFNLEGEFVPMYTDSMVGVPMIRAVMEYSLEIPDITNLKDVSYVNEDFITIEGRTKADCTVNVYVNDEKQLSVETEDKTFNARVELPEFENRIMVTAENDGVETSPSAVKVVMKDKNPPALIIEEPVENAKINSEVVHIRGNASDDLALENLLINGMEVEVNEDGDFYHRLILEAGENIITIKAIDIAGNETVVNRKVYVELNTSLINNIEPSEDVALRPGDILTVSFEALSGGEGYFRLVVPHNLEANKKGIPMVEINGLYMGEWIVPEDIEFNELFVEVIYVDPYGVERFELAEGRVIIVRGEAMENLPTNTVIVGNEAYHMDYLNKDSDAQLKLVQYLEAGGEVYIKIDEGVIININGQLRSLDDLPDELIYYDEGGQTTKYIK